METNATKTRAEFYLKKATTVHVKTKSAFYNGIIIEIVGEDFFIVNDRMFGEIPITFSEVIKLEPYKERERGDEEI
jgi:hypothetical protein